MNKIWVIGLGPGHPDYMLPIAKIKLSQADRIYGGKRHLEGLDVEGDKVKLLIPLQETIQDIKKYYKDKQVAVLVSGDTGFYSFLETLKRDFKSDELETYPGISSLQYMFSRLNMSYQEAFIGSVHGRRTDLDQVFNKNVCGLLTDKIMTPSVLVDEAIKLGKSGWIHIGENLSYEDEVIASYRLEDYKERTHSSLCVVVMTFD
ncbi:precorrin-6y C5,15-methyltransferase (decarboxylating) subunit CbiE [Acidaminobacter sp. JC074]|uniref:precorrin-6y C5,15-methyltransferase (decarboxylating) subunit CbiE n=1 Tax=Acidaminobacter sp. JC074 TaxID=2530199 RepID=UPI001F0D223D|nr:precorrin-6y C5,15-methyltransferase (decarboxylating) subunit CbiE [Acidaminobacter sp. JC074]